MLAAAGTLSLINGIFAERIDQITEFAIAAEGGKDYGVLLVNLGVFAVVVLALATVVKSIPTFAAGLTGGVALQAASAEQVCCKVSEEQWQPSLAAPCWGTRAVCTDAPMLRIPITLKKTGDALKSQAQHLLGSGGLTNPGSFAAATAGHAAGAVRQFFTDPDKLRTPANAGC